MQNRYLEFKDESAFTPKISLKQITEFPDQLESKLVSGTVQRISENNLERTKWDNFRKSWAKKVTFLWADDFSALQTIVDKVVLGGHAFANVTAF